MSMIGELTFFLSIQVKQMKQGTFVHQAKYMKDLMKKFNMAELKPVSTQMNTATSLGKDEDGELLTRGSTGVRLPLSCTSRDTARHSVHCVLVCTLSDFAMLFASDGSSTNLQVSQTHTRV
jgi:hypothetical protein